MVGEGQSGRYIYRMKVGSVDGSRLALPGGPYKACLFDMDGVLTDTAALHSLAWKQTFDAFLKSWSEHEGKAQPPFDSTTDYGQYVDGKSRDDGVRSFLDSRGIQLEDGTPEDPPTAATVGGLGNRKNEILVRLIRGEGVRAFPGSLRFLRVVKAADLKVAVVTSSTNCAEVLAAAGLERAFDARIDGHDLAALKLAGKPAPDTYLEAARRLRVPAAAAVVFEDAISGVEAGRAGGFGLVVGVVHQEPAQILRRHGADIVVLDLSELITAP